MQLTNTVTTKCTETGKINQFLPLYRKKKLYRVKKMSVNSNKQTLYVDWMDRKNSQLEKRDDAWATLDFHRFVWAATETSQVFSQKYSEFCELESDNDEMVDTSAERITR